MRYLLRSRRDIHSVRGTISTAIPARHPQRARHDIYCKSGASPMLPKLATAYREMHYDGRNLSSKPQEFDEF